MQLTKESPIPLYYQLKDILKGKIEEGIYQPGDLLPSETELMANLDVSRTTVRLALRELESEGLVKREQGKGTFVLPKKIEVRIAHLLSFSQEIERLGYRPGSQLLEVSVVESDSVVAKKLELEPQSEVLRVVRIRTADGRPIAFCVSYVNLPRFPELRDQDFSKVSIYELFEKDMKLSIVRATQHITSDTASEKEAKILHLARRAPILRVQRTTFVQGDIPIECVDAAFDGTIYGFYTELFRESALK